MTGSREYFDAISVKWDEMQRSFFTAEVRKLAIGVANVQKGQVKADSILPGKSYAWIIAGIAGVLF